MSELSTRCQILFRNTRSWKNENGETETSTEELLTYKHCDGYPSSVIPLLREYYQWSGRTNDFEYFTASWFYYNKRLQEEWRAKSEHNVYDVESKRESENMDEFEVPKMETGYGICANGAIHGDIEHFYLVDLSEQTIEHYKVSFGSADRADSAEDLVSDREADEIYSLIPNTDLPHQADYKKYFEDGELKLVDSEGDNQSTQ